MKQGFYEKIITDSVQKELDKNQQFLKVIEPFEKEDGSVFINRFFQSLIQKAFAKINSEKEESAKPKLIELTNQLISLLSNYTGQEHLLQELIEPQGNILKALFDEGNFSRTDIKEHIKEVFPLTGLSESELFTGNKSGISLESELKKEMLSSDEVCWLVSFIKFEGIRLFEQVFKQLELDGKKVKVICTVYMGATDLKAIDFLSQFSNVEIKISFNTQQERLHAKTYIFKRESGFHTGYIGSSNLSRTALTNGLEWNLKITEQEIPHIIEKCIKTFETYWNDNDFVLYNKDEHREKLKAALQIQNKGKDEDTIEQFFDFTPFSFQQEILDQLEKCRQNGEYKNLIVAATGTGKTVMAAFDFKKFLKTNPTARFLFVAHREEILKQSRYTFRHILRDNNFGELWFSRNEPTQYNQLFASINTLNNRIDDLKLNADYFDYIVIDEVHHSSANSYQKILNHFTPKLLIGLTATPERMDGADITHYFGKSISAEIRLTEALNRRLLCPFQYFALSDDTDLSQISWRRGKYDISALEKVFSEDDRRVNDILRNCNKYLKDIKNVCAIGFCVSVKHAEFMHEKFSSKGMSSAYLTSANTEERNTIIQKFRRKEINYLFVVDIFNEGIDIPEIDTLLFLRPTESLTIFLQQLGRGLRIHEDKSYLTVLDFVGQSNAEYSFEHKFRAMVGKTHTKIKDEIENDFPHLPLGCSIVLERQAKDIILKNVQRHIRGGVQKIKQAILRFKQDYTVECTLSNFIRLTDLNLKSIYDTDWLWYELNSMVDGNNIESNASNKKIAGAMSNAWLACESNAYFNFIIEWINAGCHMTQSELAQQYLLMFYFDIFNEEPKVDRYEDLELKLKEFLSADSLKKELVEYFSIRINQIEAIEKEINFGFKSTLKLHGRFTRNQILVGLKANTLNRKYPSREGVLNLPDIKTEALFVTLDKTEGRFSPSTMYHDYFVNSEIFHWQSQNATTPESSKGQSYINHQEIKKSILLFIREKNTDEDGITMGFVFCGHLNYVSHEGTRPMNIIWRLKDTPPALLLNEGKKLAVG